MFDRLCYLGWEPCSDYLMLWTEGLVAQCSHNTHSRSSHSTVNWSTSCSAVQLFCVAYSTLYYNSALTFYLHWPLHWPTSTSYLHCHSFDKHKLILNYNTNAQYDFQLKLVLFIYLTTVQNFWLNVFTLRSIMKQKNIFLILKYKVEFILQQCSINLKLTKFSQLSNCYWWHDFYTF